jgi:FkbM family methyltransferase
MHEKTLSFAHPCAPHRTVVLVDRAVDAVSPTTVEFVYQTAVAMRDGTLRDVAAREAPFIDVGAHVGLMTVVAALAGRPVIAVEPDPDNLSYLRRNVEMNGVADRVLILENALWSSSGERLELCRAHGNSGQTSAVVAHGGSRFVAETVSLYDLLEQADLRFETFNGGTMKIDVEGAEFRALWAASPQTLNRIYELYIEYHPPEIDQGAGMAAVAALHSYLRQYVVKVHAPPPHMYIDYFPGKKT